MTKEEYLESVIMASHKSVMSFAKNIDVPYTTIKGMLSRGVSGAAVQTVLKVCDALGLDIEYLMEEKYNYFPCDFIATKKSPTPAESETGETDTPSTVMGRAVGRAYEDADVGIQVSVRKLLDVEESPQSKSLKQLFEAEIERQSRRGSAAAYGGESISVILTPEEQKRAKELLEQRREKP